MAGRTVAIADPKYAERVQPPAESSKRPLTDSEQKEKATVDAIITARERYENDRKGKEREWTESFKMYMSWIDTTLNPFLSNLFIPKTHEAVELLSAFLIGTKQTITTAPENGEGDTKKSMVAGKWLDFLWRKVLGARLKILIFIKQGIVFGNGFLKVGWDNKKKKTWMSNCAIEDIYFDYFEPDLQASEYFIHEIRRSLDDVKNDTKYDVICDDGKYVREYAITGGQTMNQTEALFNTFDRSFSRSECRGKVLVMEVWCLGKDGGKQKIVSLIPTELGWRIARNSDNPNEYKDGTQFRPFVKLRFKTSPVPNRGYDTGAVFPTVKIQKAFNDLINEYFDAVVLINSPMWLKRRGARINPMELVRRPGGVITVSDLDKDLRQEQIGDVKQSIIEMLNRLDREFQEASMVVNLLKGISQSETATGDALAQQNSQTLLDMIDQNIVEALSELGQMVLSISLSSDDGIRSLQLYENDSEVGTLSFKPQDIDGIHDVKITPDRSGNISKAVIAKQLIDFLKIISQDQVIQAKYPLLRTKIYKTWLEKQGIGDPEYFFQEEAPADGAQIDPVTGLPIQSNESAGGGVRSPAPGEQLSDEAIQQSIMKGAGMVK